MRAASNVSSGASGNAADRSRRSFEVNGPCGRDLSRQDRKPASVEPTHSEYQLAGSPEIAAAVDTMRSTMGAVRIETV
jgi:hypothetical protein